MVKCLSSMCNVQTGVLARVHSAQYVWDVVKTQPQLVDSKSHTMVTLNFLPMHKYFYIRKYFEIQHASLVT